MEGGAGKPLSQAGGCHCFVSMGCIILNWSCTVLGRMETTVVQGSGERGRKRGREGGREGGRMGLREGEREGGRREHIHTYAHNVIKRWAESDKISEDVSHNNILK